MVDLSGFFEGGGKVFLGEQVDGFLTVLYASRRVDAGAYLEDDVADGDFLVGQSAHVDDGLQPDTGVAVQLLQAVEGQYAVLAHDRDNVRSDADGHKVEQGDEVVELDAVADGKRLHELESYAAAREVLVGVGVVEAFGVEYGYSGWQHVVGHVMVADDEVDAFLAGIGYLVHSLDAAVEHDDEFDARLHGVVHSFVGHPVAFVVAVGDVIVDVRVELLNKLVDQCHGCGTVYVVVSVNQYPFFLSHCLVQARYGHVHVLHQEGVVEFGQLWAEEFPCGGSRRYSPFHEQSSQYGVNAQFPGQCLACLCLFGCDG
ncbi:unknown [Bacteroides sp. CAG:633]|nr:unknown [Bacteroides sp. CAG:633]